MMFEMSEMSEMSDASEVQVSRDVMKSWAEEQREMCATQLAQVEGWTTRTLQRDHVAAALAEELNKWDETIAGWANTPAPARAPYHAVVIAQEWHKGRWWATWRYDSGAFWRASYGVVWARARLAILRARSFAPPEREGQRRLVAELWDVSRDGSPLLVSEHTI